MNPIDTRVFFSDRSIGFVSSAAFHAALFMLGGAVLARPVQYAVESGTGGFEVSLTAAPADRAAGESMPELLQDVSEPDPSADPEAATDPAAGIPQPRPVLEPEKQASPAALSTANPEYQGDGSSSVPGQDATTLYASGGALTEAQPHYLRNPAPPYPREARDNGWEGLVLLRVRVDRSGRASEVQMERSSGYDVLDAAALKTVRSWKFRPARLGGLAVESAVRIPVRFELNKTNDRSKRHT